MSSLLLQPPNTTALQTLLGSLRILGTSSAWSPPKMELFHLWSPPKGCIAFGKEYFSAGFLFGGQNEVLAGPSTSGLCDQEPFHPAHLLLGTA